MRKNIPILALFAFAVLFSSCPVHKADPVAITYTVTYHEGGAEAGTAPGPQTKKKGETISLASNSGGLALAGMCAVSWNTQADGRGTDYLFGSSYSLDADLDLYVKFLAEPELASINPSDGVLDKDFHPATTEYVVILADDIARFSLDAAVPAGSGYSISYSVPQPMTLSMGSNPLTVSVGIPGAAERVYSFDVRREGRFITEWEIPSAGTSVTLPLAATNSSSFDCVVDWGDGTELSSITDAASASRTHSYAVPGRYRIAIQGTCEGWSFSSASASALLLKKVLSWGADPVFSGFKYLKFDACAGLDSLATGGIKGAGLAALGSVFRGCSGLASLPADLFRFCPAVANFDMAFARCASLTSLPADLFRYNTAVTSFSFTFSECAGVTSLPGDLFRYNTATARFYYTFNKCTGLTALPAELFRYNTAVPDFEDTFSECTGLTSLPADLFYFNTAVTSFTATFGGCIGLTTLPADLFRGNTAVTIFRNTFVHCTGLTTLPADLFRYNTAVTSFSQPFLHCTGLTSLPADLFANNTEVKSFDRTFLVCTGLMTLPAGLFRNNTAVENFSGTFMECGGIETLPADLFRPNAGALDFGEVFCGCNGLVSLPADLFRYNPAVTNFRSAFSGCAGLTSLPADLFRYNPAATCLEKVFYQCAGLASLPADLFRYNTAATSFREIFGECSNLTSLPPDLFRYNAMVTNFFGCFRYCAKLASLPADLFRYNAAATSFEYAFYGCDGLSLNSTIFYQAGGESTRFAGKTVDFTNCFYRTAFSGAQGTAPNLWGCAGSMTTANCLGGDGNSSISLANYDSIPMEWKQ